MRLPAALPGESVSDCWALRGTALATIPAPVPSTNFRREILLIHPPARLVYCGPSPPGPMATDCIVAAAWGSIRLEGARSGGVPEDESAKGVPGRSRVPAIRVM